jgi:hypothetical protein
MPTRVPCLLQKDKLPLTWLTVAMKWAPVLTPPQKHHVEVQV